MNVLLLMAGSDDGFREAGSLYPKNLVEIGGLPLVQRVLQRIEDLRAAGHQLIVCLKKDETRKFHTDSVVRLLASDADVVEVAGSTAGAACTALLAIGSINNDEPLLILNGDQIIEQPLSAIVAGFDAAGHDGGIVVFEAVHPRWSYVRCNELGYVVEAAEKRPISKLATAGAYYFSRGRDFVACAMDMIRKDAHHNGAFYVCPVYNEMVLRQRRVGVHLIPTTDYFSLATPASVHHYEAHCRTKEGFNHAY